MNWKFGRPLSDVNLIGEFEKLHSMKFSDFFIETVTRGNGGYPDKDTFDTTTSKGKTIQCLLSFNKTDDSNIWSANEGVTGVVRFACNDFGGYLVFDSQGKVFFQNHETGDAEFAADCFEDFVKRLY